MEKMDKPAQPERTEQVIPKRKRTARQHGLRFSGKTSAQFQQEIQAAATESLEGRNVSEREVLSGDHSKASEVPSTYPWEPQPLAHPTETRPTKKQKAMTNQALSGNQPNPEANRAFGEAGPSRPRSYEEWKASQEGQNPRLKPVRSPEGHIYGYDPKDFDGFCKRTRMQERSAEDRINKSALDNVVRGKQLGAGKGEKKWTSPDPVIQEKVQNVLSKRRERDNIRRKKLKEQDPKKYKEILRTTRDATREWRKKLKEQNHKKYQEILRKDREIKNNERKKLKEQDPKKYKEVLRKGRRGMKKWIIKLKNSNHEKYEKLLEWRREKYKKFKEDPEYCKAFLERKYKRKEEWYTREMSQLNTSMENASPSQQEELQKAEQDLISQWNTFQKQYEADLKKLEQLFQQRELQQRQEYMAIEGKLDALMQRYLDKDDELEPHDLENDLLNDVADPSPREANRTFGEAESSTSRDYEEWKNSEEGQDPDLKPVRSPGGQIYGYDPRDFESFCEETGMQKRSSKDRIRKEQLDQIVHGRQLGTRQGKGKWTSPDPKIQKKQQEYLTAKRHYNKRIREERRKDTEKNREFLLGKRIDDLMTRGKFSKDPGSRKQYLQGLMKKPEYCKSFFARFLKRGYNRKEKKYKIIISQVDARMKKASTSQRDGGGSKGKSIERVLQQAKQDLKSRWDNFQEQYQADLEKLDEIIHQLEQLQRAPEQGPSLSERDEPSNQQQRELPQRQLHMAIGGELETLIRRYESNDDEFDLSKLDELELYGMNNLGEPELHNLENDLLNDFADLDDSSSSDV
jgi:hypothetical protein